LETHRVHRAMGLTPLEIVTCVLRTARLVVQKDAHNVPIAMVLTQSEAVTCVHQTV